jgi:hypothetical protein
MKKAFLIFVLAIFSTLLFAQTKTELKTTDLAKPISEYISKNFNGFTIDKAFKIDTKGVITYNVCVSKDKLHEMITFSKEGKFLLKEPCTNECCQVTNK